MIKLCEQILEMHSEFSKDNSLQKKILYLENKIDDLIYELYNLTPEEIQIIETANESN